MTTTATDQQKLGHEPTANASTYIKPDDIEWKPTRFEGIEIKVLYQDKDKVK